jgi:hypothetical protein
MVLTLSLLGCPPAEQQGSAPAEQVQTQLNLKLASTSQTVGAQADLNLAFGQDSSALFGAMIADDGEARTTTWHADPADAVTFNADTNQVTFNRAGPVKIWATFVDADGTELKSNEVDLQVAAAAAQPE